MKTLLTLKLKIPFSKELNYINKHFSKNTLIEIFKSLKDEKDSEWAEIH